MFMGSDRVAGRISELVGAAPGPCDSGDSCITPKLAHNGAKRTLGTRKSYPTTARTT
jgi:hypothetical protein